MLTGCHSMLPRQRKTRHAKGKSVPISCFPQRKNRISARPCFIFFRSYPLSLQMRPATKTATCPPRRQQPHQESRSRQSPDTYKPWRQKVRSRSAKQRTSAARQNRIFSQRSHPPHRYRWLPMALETRMRSKGNRPSGPIKSRSWTGSGNTWQESITFITYRRPIVSEKETQIIRQSLAISSAVLSNKRDACKKNPSSLFRSSYISSRPAEIAFSSISA